ncbi:type III secretion system cytoplasmic ring protein SctQ [Burkholderia pseudomallei]|uniref:type III secretion system cytoplasmic ring protein SctQ n=1 Tax=Burkholderia pseudomallei TaxID=28450 RepID=UPI000976F890|nr:type III secretion system cytoplasmic ring protein SctQ [Burkholderia pseudomallei]OMR42384.1 type III secretion protein [Burkholderia pseudomallei]CAJ2846836.1 type III secretion inner membrane protein SctQ [Burkholderia pseudomallei]CAJ3189509.1 type III secretion inner membrane protein SctQ [Burkholderia pseudomallei]CAJ3216744.1 type III secretion inner membrane protein SctQ [Burkholderia pseudomallei]CAJ7158886.1 type III secretion inner membrane protein SctQ [Burkholderia pseudomallei
MNTEPIELEPATAEPPGIDTALPLPACSAFDAALARIVCDARLAAWLARFPGLSDWRASADERPCFERPGMLELRRGGAAAHVAIDLAAFPALEVVAAPALDARGDASLSLRAALAATLLAPLVAAFAAAGLDGVTVGALRAVPAAALDATRCMLSFALDGAPLRCALLDAQAPWLDALAARLRDERRRDAASGLARVRLPGRVRLGTRALPLAVLRSLRPGDVLLDMVPAALGAARAGPLHAWWGARRAAQWHATVLIEGTTMTMTEMPDTADDLDEPIVAGDLPADSLADFPADSPAAVPAEFPAEFPADRAGDLPADSAAHSSPGSLAGLPAGLPADAPPRDARYAAPEPADLGEVALPVHVEIDTLSLSIAELAALRPGYVLELPLAARDVPVRLVAYGQAIGGGRLVAVGAHLGVRIDRMAGDDGSV